MEDEKILTNEEELKLPLEKSKEIDNVKMIIQDTVLEFHNYIFPKYISNYKKYLWFVAERMWSIDSWQSNINYPMVSSAVDTMFSNIFDFWYEFWINEPTLKKLCVESFDFRGTWKKVFSEVAKEVLICGKWYVKDYFVKEDHSDTFFGQEIKTTVKTPSMYYVSVFDVLYDRSKWLRDSPYNITRTFVTGDSIKTKVLPLLFSKKEWEDRKAIASKLDKLLDKYKDTHSSRFSMYDYNPVKALTATSQWLTGSKDAEYYTLSICKNQKQLVWIDSTSVDEKRNNYFLNAKKSTYEMVEYNTNTEKYIFINGNLIYFGPKKYNLSDIREASYSIISGTGNSNGVSDKLGGLQDIQNTLWNAFIDNIKLNLWPMFKISGNIPAWKNGTLDFKAFRSFRSNGWADIEKIQLGSSDFAPLNFMQMVESAGLKESGMNNYVSWGGWTIERTSAGIDLKFNQYKSKLTPITDSIDQMMGDIARSWIKMYFKFFTIEELEEKGVMVTSEYEKDKAWKEVFKTFKINDVDIKDIIDENKITFTYNSLDKVTKENSRETIITNLQYMLQYIPGQMNMTEIWKILAWQDFDPLKLFVEPKEKPQAWGPWDFSTAPQWWLPDEKWNIAPDQWGQDPQALLAALGWWEWVPGEPTLEDRLSAIT